MFVVGVIFIMLVPIARVAVDLDTFIHPWRPELAIAVVVSGFSIWALSNAEFARFLARMPRVELINILLPIICFAIWSGISGFWAFSWTSALHHSTVWFAYAAVYVLGRFFLRKRETLDLLIWAAIGFLLLICLPPLIEYFTYVVGNDALSIRARYTKYTEITNVLLPLVAIFAIRSKGKRSLAGFAIVVMIGFFDLASLSRAGIGIFGFVLISIVAVVFVSRELSAYRKKTALLAAIVVISVALFNLLLAAELGKAPIVARMDDPVAADSSNIRRLFRGVAIEMWRENPLAGVGADNFGQVFVTYRSRYAALNPADHDLILAEQGLAERAHNEYLQILSELGIFGALIFAWLILGIAVGGLTLFRHRSRSSMYTTASFIGIAAFLASSLVSSYSFRLVQNGVVFFIVLAIAVGGTIGRRKTANSAAQPAKLIVVKTLIAAAMLSSIALAWFCIYRVTAVQEVLNSNSLETLDQRKQLIEKAISIDPENGAIQAYYGNLLLNNGKANDAIPHLREAIRVGQATSIDYSYLATAQILTNDRIGAEETIAEALQAYPYSVFLRIRHAVILKDLGRQEESEAEFNKALAINDGQARSWWNFIDKGGAVAAQLAFDEKLPPLGDLLPGKAVYAIKTERELRFPDEKFKLPMPSE